MDFEWASNLFHEQFDSVRSFGVLVGFRVSKSGFVSVWASIAL